MRLKIIIDGMYHQIDSTDPETLGRWMVEIFGRVTSPTPATLFQVMAQPSWIPDGGPHGGHPDWIADGRFNGGVADAKSPRELVDALTAWLDAYERKDS